MNGPDYHFLSAPLWLITTLHVVTLTLHFLAMNFVFGGVIVLLFGRLRDKWQNPAVVRLVDLLPVATAATVTLGVAPLLFLQLVYPQQAYSAAITSAWPWLMIVGAVIALYYLLYASAFSRSRAPRRVPILMSLALVALAYVSIVYSSVFSMAEHPEEIRRLYASNPSGWAFHSNVGVWGLRWLHMVTGAVAVGGFVVGVVGRDRSDVFELGKRFFLWGMIAAMGVGTAYLLSLGGHLAGIMRSPAIWILVVAVVLSLGAMHLFFKAHFAAAGSLLGASVLGMVSVRHIVRLIALGESFDPAAIPVRPNWGVFAIFLVFFVVAVATVGVMVRLYFADRRAA